MVAISEKGCDARLALRFVTVLFFRMGGAQFTIEVEEFDAEAVCVISNQKLTRKIVYGMMSRGIPAFGAIWDS